MPLDLNSTVMLNNSSNVLNSSSAVASTSSSVPLQDTGTLFTVVLIFFLLPIFGVILNFLIVYYKEYKKEQKKKLR